MTEDEWVNAAKPFSCTVIASHFGKTRKLRMLMVGFLEPLQQLFSSDARSVFLDLRDWAEDDRISVGSLPQMGRNTGWDSQSLATRAVSWVYYEASRFQTTSFWGAEELCDKAAHPLIFTRVGRSPLHLPLSHPTHQAWAKAWRDEFQLIQAQQTRTMHCVFGNPFRRIRIDSNWLTWSDRTVAMLAQVIYDERAFDRMPILADALEESGCTNEEILGHLRGPEPHVRGCWVLDLLLGKE